MIRKFFYFFRFPALLLLLNIFLVLGGVYDLIPGIDIPMHFLGGFSIAYSFCLIFGYFEEKHFLKINNRFVYFFLIVAIVVLFAVCWEFFEFGLEFVTGFNAQLGLNDTMGDLLMGFLGGVIGGLFFQK